MKVIVQDLVTEYQDEGHGKVILFLHGWQDNLETFNPLVSILSSSNRIIRVNLPGSGGTEIPKEDWSLDRYVNFVNDLIEKLDTRVDVLIGHSLGGRIAIKGASEGILQPEKVVLISSAGLIKSHNFRNTILKYLSKIGKIFLYLPPLLFWRESLRGRLYKSIGSDYLDAGKMKGTFLNIISEDLCESAKKITIPTLLIWGSNDTETPLSDGKRLSQLISDSKLVVFDNSGHFVHREKADDVAKAIQEFIR